MTEDKDGARAPAGLKPAQIVASALAAVTAAFLGSTLGVTGTLVGSGIASVITTVGSEVYLRSLRKTQEAARRTKGALGQAPAPGRPLQTRRIERPPTRPVNPLGRSNDPTVRRTNDPAVGRGSHPTVRRTNDPTVGRGSHPTVRRTNDPTVRRGVDPTARLRPGETPTVRLPLPGRPPPGQPPPAARSAVEDPTLLVSRSDSVSAGPKRPWWKSRWTIAAGLSVFAFLVGMLVLTGFETVTGHTLSGASGTTLGQIGGGGGNAPSGPPPPPAPTKMELETPSYAPTTAPSRPASTSDSAPSPTPTPTPSQTTGNAPSSESPTPSPSEPPSPQGGGSAGPTAELIPGGVRVEQH